MRAKTVWHLALTRLILRTAVICHFKLIDYKMKQKNQSKLACSDSFQNCLFTLHRINIEPNVCKSAFSIALNAGVVCKCLNAGVVCKS